eukprot:3270303-Pyramimonas_sp.AAC.1
MVHYDVTQGRHADGAVDGGGSGPFAQHLRSLCFAMSRREGTSMARYMVARLAPLHKDPLQEQEARFPPVALLPKEARAALQAKFLATDEPSFSEWMYRCCPYTLPVNPSVNP